MKNIFLAIILPLVCLRSFGQTPVMTMTTTSDTGSDFSFILGAADDNTPVQVDFGDGTQVNFIINMEPDTVSGTLTGSKTIKIYGSGITNLDCKGKNLTALNVSGNTTLVELNCLNNRITTLDLTENTLLEQAVCQQNLLTTLKLPDCNTLQYLYLDDNHISAIDVSKNPELLELTCANNAITELDITNNTKLSGLQCSGNEIQSLDVTENTELTSLSCGNNLIESLDVSKNTLLFNLDCYGNQLTALDVSQNNNLIFLICDQNRLSFSTLPVKDPSWITYTYAPQQMFDLKESYTTGEQIDLSTQLNVNGTETSYVWRSYNTGMLTEGIDYSISEGITTFLKEFPGGVFCEMNNSLFPDFEIYESYRFRTTTANILTASGIENNSFSEIKIFSVRKTLFIEVPEKMSMAVYQLNGNLIMSGITDQGNNRFQIPDAGLYLVVLTGNQIFYSEKILAGY